MDDTDRLFLAFRDRGDTAALGRLFDRLAPELFAIARGLAGRSGAAEDLVQDTFLTAIEHAESFDGERRVAPWLVGILVNHARNRARRERGWEGAADALAGAAARGPGPAAEAEAREFAVELERSLRRLPPLYREVLLRRFAGGDRGDAIARELERPAATVRSQLARGLALLAGLLPRGLAVLAAVGLGSRRGLARARRATLEAGARAAGVTPLAPRGASAALRAAAVLACAGVIGLLVAGRGAEDEPAAVTAELSARSAGVAADAVASSAALRSEAGDAAGEGERARVTIRGRIAPPPGDRREGIRVVLLRCALVPALECAVEDTKTDAAGAFEFAASRWRPASLHALAVDPGGSNALLRVIDEALAPGGQLDVGALEVAPRTRLKGRVVDEEGRPLAGARLRAIPLPAMALELGFADLASGGAVATRRAAAGGRMEYDLAFFPAAAEPLLRALPFPETRSGADGTFELAGAARGLVALAADCAGFGTLAADPLFVGGVDEQAVGDLVLLRGDVLEGEVVDGAGRPVASAELAAGALPPLYPGSVLRPAGVADARGHFRIDGLRGPEVLVAARAAGRAPAAVVVAAGATSCRIVLEDVPPSAGIAAAPEPALVMGRVSGTALPCWVTVRSSAGERIPRFVASSADGRFDLAGVAPGDLVLQVRRRPPPAEPEAVYRELGRTEGALAELQLHAAPGERLEVAIDAASGEAEPERHTVRGRVVLDGAPGVGLRVTIASTAGALLAAGACDASGAFALDAPRGVVAVLRVREPEFLFESFGRILATRELDLAEGGLLAIEIETGSVRGRVVDGATGQPVAFAGLRLRAGAEGAGEPAGVWTSAYGTTDARGTFHLAGVPAGRYRLKIARDGFAEAAIGPIDVPARGAAAPVHAAVERTVAAAGRVVGRRAGEVERIGFVRDGLVTVFAAVDRRDGTFATSGLAPATYRVVTVPAGPPGEIEPTAVVPAGGTGDLAVRVD